MVAWVAFRVACAAALAFWMSRRGLAKKSLDTAGAVTAFCVGFLCLAASWRCGVCLFVFYFTSSRVTKIGSARKQKLEGGNFNAALPLS